MKTYPVGIVWVLVTLGGAVGCADSATTGDTAEPLVESRDCFSPTQNVDRAYDEGAVGCACEVGVDQDVCVGRAALVCKDNLWRAVEDGPCRP